MKLLNKHIAVLMITLITLSSSVFSRNFYVSSSYQGTTSNGSLTTPWKSLANVQSNFSLIQAGDSVLFKRGDSFSGTLILQSKTGIVFSAYGTGNNPLFWGTGSTVASLFSARGSSNIQFLNWDISDTTISATDRTVQAKIQVVFKLELSSSNITVRNCKMDRMGYGVYITLSSSGMIIDGCDIGNLRMIKNTPTSINPDDDYGGVPVQLSSSNNRIINNYFHDCWAQSYDYGYDGGGIEFFEEGAAIANNFIAYNTFYDCNGTFEHGSSSDGVANFPIQNNVFAYNKIINCSSLFYINNNGQYKCSVTNQQFYNNVIIQTVTSRTGNLNIGSMAVLENRTGMVVMKNNVLHISNGARVMKTGLFTAGQLEHKNNVFKLSNGSVLNFTIDPSEVQTSAVLWNNTTNTNPLYWNLEPANSSLLIDFGTPAGQTRDILGNGINNNPDAGVIEKVAQLTSPLQADGSVGAINCFGDSTTVTITATGGTSPYQGVGNFRVLAGTRSFIVSDATGSKDTVTLTITQPTALGLTLTSGTIIVTGGNTTITATANGGTSPYTYALDGGTFQSGNIFSGVVAGSHNVVLKDSKGCLKTATMNLTQPAALLNININPGTISCFGGTAIVSVSATGGTSPYTGTGNFSVLAGTYTYTVRDANGVTKSASVNITQPSALVLSLSAGTIAQNGGSTSITATVTGGSAPFTYSLDGAAYQTNNIFSGVFAGTHSVIVKDAKGCIKSSTISISQPAVLLNINVAAENITCHGGTTTVTVSVTGGTAPYTGTGTFVVSAGSYTYTVSDASGLSNSASITLTEPRAIQLNATAGTIQQYNGTTNITMSASGGTAPYLYSINNGNLQSSNTITGIPAGSYAVRVIDNNECLGHDTVQIMPYVIQPIAVRISADSIACNGGTAQVQVAATGGVGPYQGTGTFQLGAGTHRFTIIDSLGTQTTASITLGEPTQINATVQVGGLISVAGGTTSVTVNATGGTGSYQYKLDGGAVQSSNFFAQVGIGSHVISVTDVRGCIATVNFQLDLHIPLSFAQVNVTNVSCQGNNDGSIQVSGNGGTSSYQFSINGGSFGTSGYFSGLVAGVYQVRIKDAAGSVKDSSVVVMDGSTACISGRIDNTTKLSTQVYPNPSSSQFYVKAITSSTSRVRIEVSNFNGNVVYRANGLSSQTFIFGSQLQAGIYYVRMIQDNQVVVTKLIKL